MAKSLTVGVRGAMALAVCFAIGCTGLVGCAGPQAAAPDEGDAASASVHEPELDLNSISPRTNDDGLVYGTGEQAEQPGAKVDLVAVQATNGRTGYAYYSELLEAEGAGVVEDPEEATQLMETREEESNRALAEQLTRLLPAGMEVTPDQASTYLDAAVRGGISDPEASGIEAMRQQGVAELAKATGIPEVDLGAVIDDACYEAQMQVSTYIPVYESDGKTGIGEFAVGGLS